MSDTTEPVFELVDGQAIDESAASMAVQGLKNELNRLHELHKIAAAADMKAIYDGLDRAEIWTRIVVIQEALLDVARWLVKKA
jgi:hypothetical protein